MTVKEIVKRRLVRDTEGYERIAIYGTGVEAERVIGLLDDNTRTKIVGIIDRDDSEWIGRVFFGYKVFCTENLDSSLLMILIANNRYKKEIEERLKKDLNVSGVEIVSLYDFSKCKVRDNSIDDKVKFVEYLENVKQQENTFFVPYNDVFRPLSEGPL